MNRIDRTSRKEKQENGCVPSSSILFILSKNLLFDFSVCAGEENGLRLCGVTG
jgi:hypothetical protein